MDEKYNIDKFEKMLDELHKEKFELIEDFDQDGSRVVMLKHRTLHCTLILSSFIKFDIYSQLNSGIYELGELHVLTRNMLNVKKICLAYEAEEMNTTERLYPENRRGKNTKTSGL
ncbi:MAG: hypothetical protein HeimC2_29170 [Candidatus Heimdallarchaeota archaeon LC_2]|nr:MAG: hypothetical protein HeimC2_29170 [Candidatus Heimdallarchaeota archaeon LC_2]